ncbi:flavodoxin family protein [Gangjinia marincola]|uniref:Flavodoxin family protein n=1 Tax=Gangjinia marincola TaxID=578463 RepID=A0ABN1MG45_9FLAO
MISKTLILLGSSNSKGETKQLVNYMSNKAQIPIIDLKKKYIVEFDYEFRNQDDDFKSLLEEIVTTYDTLIFATPVYWYTMSARMKLFFDRLSDGLKLHKDIGRKLRGMNMAVLSCGYDKVLKDGFHMPFKETAKYLGMNYSGDVHGWLENGILTDEIKERLDNFIEVLDVR